MNCQATQSNMVYLIWKVYTKRMLSSIKIWYNLVRCSMTAAETGEDLAVTFH